MSRPQPSILIRQRLGQRTGQRLGQRLDAGRRVAGLLALTVLIVGCAGPDGAGPAQQAVTPAPDATTSAPSPGPATSAPETGTPGAYLSLADYQRDPSVHAGDDVVLFFAASWCSTCRRTRANIEADLAGIPPGLVIVVVDYDAATDLRRQYGVTVQHTFVQIDTDGTELKRWAGSLTAQQIAEQTV
jgi:thioredoxin 1